MKLNADDRLGLDIKRTEQALMTAKSIAVRKYGLTVPQYAALFAISGNRDITAAALARTCMVSPQAMTVLVRGLLERGLVERVPHEWHRHIKQLRLTCLGIDSLNAADARAVVVEAAIIGEFTAQEREQLRDLLGRARNAIADAAETLVEPVDK